MPRENKKRGRRAEQKEKVDGAQHGDGNAAEASLSKRPRFDEDVERNFSEMNGYSRADDYNGEAEENYDTEQFDSQFGMLDEQQETFFKQAEQDIFYSGELDEQEQEYSIVNTFFHAEGSELKLASHPILSKFLERLISLAAAPQVLQLFKAFSGNVNELIKHRFASHSCESLCARTAELVSSIKSTTNESETEGIAQIQTAFLDMVTELQPNASYYLSDSYGSHVMRVLMTVLSGQALPKSFAARVLPSRKKARKLDRNSDPIVGLLHERHVPQEFKDKFPEVLTGMVIHLERGGLREAALHPVASPTLQLLLRLESGITSKSDTLKNSIAVTLFPPDMMEAPETTNWINDLLMEPSGSHFLETVVEVAPGKVFKALYRKYIRPQLETIVVDPISHYVVGQCLSRLGKEDLKSAVDSIIPLMSDLVDRQRYDLLRIIFTRMIVRELSLDNFRDKFVGCLQIPQTNKTSTDAPVINICKLLKPRRRVAETTAAETEENGFPNGRPFQIPGKVHASIFAQAMISEDSSGILHTLIAHSISELEPAPLLDVVFDPVTSRTLKCLLDNERTSTIVRRKVATKILNSPVLVSTESTNAENGDEQTHESESTPPNTIVQMAMDVAASSIVDSLKSATSDIQHIYMRIAADLAAGSSILRVHMIGHNVWKNWKMNIYMQDRSRWSSDARLERRKTEPISKPAPATGANLSGPEKGKSGPAEPRNKDGKNSKRPDRQPPSKDRNNRPKPAGSEKNDRHASKFTLSREEYLALTPIQQAAARAAEMKKRRDEARARHEAKKRKESAKED